MLDFESDAMLGEWFDGLGAWDEARDDVPSPTVTTIAYGPAPEQRVELWAAEGNGTGPLVVSLHGGYFEAAYDASLHVPVIRQLLADGFRVANVEYRRIGSGGGLEETVADVRAAVAAVADRAGRTAAGAPRGMAAFGHSAGGYLCGRLAGVPGVELLLPLAAVSDLAGASRAGWDDGSIARWIGAGPDEEPEKYRAADLRAFVPTGVRHVVLHGDADTVVGAEQSRDYAAALRRAGDDARLVEIAGDGHYGFLDPREPAFAALRDELLRWSAGEG